jgi:hypothetical protein
MADAHRPAGRPSSRLLLCAVLLAVPLAAACGSVAASGPAAGPRPASTPTARPGGTSGGAPASTSSRALPADLALCADPAAASQVVIARSPTVEQIRPGHVVQAAQSTVRDAARARALARALCALPKMPRGIINCPMMLEGRYTLWFTAAGRHLPAVLIQESGCQVVTGLGLPRTVRKSPRFWPVLASAAKAGTAIPPLPVFLPEPGGIGCGPAGQPGAGNAQACPQHARPAGTSPQAS